MQTDTMQDRIAQVGTEVCVRAARRKDAALPALADHPQLFHGMVQHAVLSSARVLLLISCPVCLVAWLGGAIVSSEGGA